MQGTAVDDSEQQMTRKPDDKEPLAGLAFKIMADQFQVCTLCTLTSLFIRQLMCVARLVGPYGADLQSRAVLHVYMYFGGYIVC